MEKLQLQPENVIIASSGQLDWRIVEVYCRVYQETTKTVEAEEEESVKEAREIFGNMVAPSIVMGWDALVPYLFSPQGKAGYMAHSAEMMAIRDLYTGKNKYLLLGDHHGALVAAIAGIPIPTLGIEKDQDIKELEKGNLKLLELIVKGETISEIGNNLRDVIWKNRSRITTVDRYKRENYQKVISS